MRLLRKVVKSSQVFSEGDSVSINNKIASPVDVGNKNTHDEANSVEVQEARFEQRVKAEVEERLAIIKKDLEKQQSEAIAHIEATKDNIIATASGEAERLLVIANQDSVHIKELARQNGFQEGFTQGKAESHAQCEKYIQAAAQFLSGINSKKEAYFISHEDELLKTVMEMVKKITLNELKTDQDTIFRILRQASKSFRNDDYIKISFAEGDVSENVITDLEFIREVVGNIKEIDVEILSDKESGTVIVDNGHEIIDASVPTQLDFLQEILNNSRK